MIDMLEGHGKLSIRKLLDSCKPSNPQDMTDQQLNRTLAELIYNARECRRDTDSLVVIIGDFGTYNTHPLTGDWKKAKWRVTAEEAWTDIPNFSSDPAASLEVQAKAIEVSADKYVSNLDVIVNPDTIGDWTNDEIAKLLIATPRKRAEAAYMTLSSQNQVNTED
ncbi:hypothetical protein L8C07_25615 [Paenibacillus sp. CMAA1739]|uniref:hypothetical protein n=1 Tax=Paenibacillus ottowii TaxID=2315729 RepID=UPI002DBD9ED8|nr:hypothetical protein [Paenibacillus sp. CMAA1739]MEC4569328.1 hypothetical protein [Paenibacillus sp. CMAA1739]